MTHPTDTAQVRVTFIDNMGTWAQNEGLARAPGRVFALLIWEGRPIAFGQIAEALEMSRGAVSGAVRLLEARGLIVRSQMPGDRQDYFSLAEDAFVEMLKAARARFAVVQTGISETMNEVQRGAPDTALRLRALVNFYAAMGLGLDTALRTLDPTGDAADEH